MKNENKLAISGVLTGPFSSYQATHHNVFAFATGRDFFHQCLPNDSLHFAYSSTAMHYLSERLCHISHCLVPFSNQSLQSRFSAFVESANYGVQLCD